MSKVADFLHPMIEIRAKKQVSRGSIMMQLSRLQKNLQKITPDGITFRTNNLTLHASLAVITYDRTATLLEKVNKIVSAQMTKDSFLALNRGSSELTLIVDSELSSYIQNEIHAHPKNIIAPVTAITIHFSEKYADVPGFLYHVIQQITLQGINIVEVTSTYSELTILVAQKDARLAFDTLYLMVDDN
ncbi:hypothetical protein HN748_03090 [Candidatus Peregrinibacteria bacterium]|nr:hypothetical protein [Candidatus Peregrinibacteria bacterium]MBT7484085.1 hypothetical protein [Candidatus Peregrinibacteria bacterium]MBT7703193.1 hypothetical protein [Candidatus Peregrinibacteria bacterium]